MPISQHPREEWKVTKKDHQGSSTEDIATEPAWGEVGNDHYPGYKNRQGRKAGHVEADVHDYWDYDEDLQAQRKIFWETKKAVEEKDGRLVNWQDALKSQKDISLYHSEGHPFGWRYVLDYTEDEIKNKQAWPANIKAREKEKQETQRESKVQNAKGEDDGSDKQQDRSQSDHGNEDDQQEESGQDRRSSYQKLLDKYTPQQIAQLHAIRHEKDYLSNLKSNNGKGHSGIKNNRTDITLAEDDQFTPDNWIPRSTELIRLTGKHPLNAEPDLRRLFDAGFITPNELHYVRSHGAVPRLYWETHELEVTTLDGRGTKFSMKDIKGAFDWINIPVFMGCDNGRRKELNMKKRTHGFNWGPAATGCAFWKGPLLRNVLLAAGIPECLPDQEEKRYWVHLQGADNPGSSLYETSIPFEYAIDAVNDVILAYEMNDVPLPPDHGYPLRIIIPGYVGGRQVKWLQKIWISEKENDSYWHIWDNRCVPPFVTSQDDEFGVAMFSHPDTALYEQYLNSVITRPSQGENIQMRNIKKNGRYRLEGFAFNGRGDEVKRVEVTLDGGETWLYCIRQFPDAPIRHGKKFWTWCFWHVDIHIAQLLSASAIRVRAWDVKFSTQPEQPTWNLMGSMNNVQYVVKSEFLANDDPCVLFRHPVEPGNGDKGWMKESSENKISDALKRTEAPKKQFTRAEIEKHDKEDDCWIIVDGKVYDATSVMSWHPGGAAPIMMHAGTVHYATTEEFSSVHDDYAYAKLNGKCAATTQFGAIRSAATDLIKECVLGVVTDKAMDLIKLTKENRENPDAKVPEDQALLTHRWVPATLSKRDWIAKDTAIYTFMLPKNKTHLGLGTCQHIELVFHLRDRMLIRTYTPTRPVIPRDSGIQISPEVKEENLYDGSGTFQLTVKTYFPDEEQPGGALSNILAVLPIGENVEMRGPTGTVIYLGHGKFNINGEDVLFKRVSMVLGGTGLTPGFSLIARAVLDPEDELEIHVLDANRSESDILLRSDLERLTSYSKGRLQVSYILSHASDKWDGIQGHVDERIIKQYLFPPRENENLVLLCGPPAMVQKAALPAFKEWGYTLGKNMFGF